MGLFGGGGGGVKLTDKAKAANDYLLGALDPSNPQFYKYGPDYQGQEFGSILQGLDNVGTFSSDGRYIPPGSDEMLPTTLPSIASIGNYDTVFEKFDTGGLSPTAAKVVENLMGMAGGAGAPDLSQFSSIGGGGAGGGISNMTGQIEFNAPPNIGELTQGIYDSMPPEFREFTQNVLDAADPASFEAELQNFEDKMTAKMMSDIDIAGESVLDVFASQGLGVGGTAITALKEMAVRGVIETNAVIASERMKSLEIYTDRLAVGNQIVQILLGAGAQEQANLVQGEVGRMQAEASVISSQLAAQAQVQSAAMYAQANLQASLANSAVDLYRVQAGLASDAFQGLLSENQLEGTQMSNALRLPYDMLGGLATTKNQKGQGGGFDLGGLLGGAAAVGSIFI